MRVLSLALLVLAFAAAPHAQDSEAVDVPVTVLERYVGSYEIQPGFVLEVRLEDGALVTQATGQDSFPMTAISETEFAPPFDARLVFEAGDPAPAVTLIQGGGRFEPNASRSRRLGFEGKGTRAPTSPLRPRGRPAH